MMIAKLQYFFRTSCFYLPEYLPKFPVYEFTAPIVRICIPLYSPLLPYLANRNHATAVILLVN